MLAIGGWQDGSAFTAMPAKTRGRASEGGSRQCDELPGLPTKDEAQEKWQRSAVWLLAIRVCSWARMEERERERERRRENPSRGAEGVTADISLRVLRLFLSSSSSCPLNQAADRRGRPTWRSKRKSVPSSISARRNRTGAEWVGCQPRNKPGALFLSAKPPTAPLQLWAGQNIPRCAVPGTSNEARQSRLHDRRTRRAFSPTCRPTPSAQPCEPSTRTSESSGTCPTTPSHWPRRRALTVAFSSCILRMTQSTLSTGPRRSRRALVSGLAAAEIALHLGNGCTIAHPLFPPAMESIRRSIPLTPVATPRNLGRFPHPQSRGQGVPFPRARL